MCVPFRARNEHEIRVWDWCHRWWSTHFPNWSIHVADSGHDPFNRSASRNIPIRDAGRFAPDVWVFANADTVYADHVDAFNAAVIAANGGWCLPSNYVETSEEYTADRLASDPGGPLPDPLSSYVRQLPDSPAGPQVVSHEAIMAVHGWDERFVGWGREDTAMQAALDVLHVPHTRHGVAVHLWHPRGREDTFRASTYPDNKARFMRTYGRALRQRTPEARRTAMLHAIP